MILGVVGIVLLHQLPHSTSNLPFVLQRLSDSVTELDFGLDNGWISTAQIRLDSASRLSSVMCTGTVHIIPARTCDAFQTQPKQVQYHRLIYLLIGSQINITLDQPNFKAVWILSSISAWNYADTGDDSVDGLTNCHSSVTDMEDYNCFEADKYNATNPIVFNVQRSGYYSVYVPGGDYSSVTESIAGKTYNLTAIILISRNVTVQHGSAREFNVVDQWKFTSQPWCVFFESSCTVPFHEINLTVLAIEKRKDVLLFPAVIIVCAAVLSVVLIIVHVVRCVKF